MGENTKLSWLSLILRARCELVDALEPPLLPQKLPSVEMYNSAILKVIRAVAKKTCKRLNKDICCKYALCRKVCVG